MTDSIGAATLLKPIRQALAVSGVIMLLVGLAVLIWPDKTALAVAWILAVYFIVAGIVYVGVGIFSKEDSGWAKFGHILLGVVYIIAAIVMFMNLQQATTILAVFVGVVVGILWIVDGFVSFSLLNKGGSKVFTVLYAILSIVAGIVLVISPMWGATVLWLLVGISLVVLGIVQIIRAISLKSA